MTKTVDMETVTSSNIDAIGYDSDDQVLHIRFRSGYYTYDGVKPELYERFKASESKGKFFKAEILPLYAGKKFYA